MGRSYGGYGADHPAGSIYSPPPWYVSLESSPQSKSEQKGAELSAREMDEIQEDAKLKAWGLGGSGKHVSLRTQEVYSVLKCMVGTSALNMSRYMLALC